MTMHRRIRKVRREILDFAAENDREIRTSGMVELRLAEPDKSLVLRCAQDLEKEGLIAMNIGSVFVDEDPQISILGLTNKGWRGRDPWLTQRWYSFREKLVETIDNKLAAVVLAGLGFLVRQVLLWLGW